MSVTEQQANNVLTLPTAALTQRRGQVGVYVEANGNSATSGGNGYSQTLQGLQSVPVTVGLYGGNVVQIKSGLTEGEEVAILMPVTSQSSGNSTSGSGGFGKTRWTGRRFWRRLRRPRQLRWRRLQRWIWRRLRLWRWRLQWRLWRRFRLWRRKRRWAVMALLSLHNVSKLYGTSAEPFFAVNDVSLAVEQGDFVAIMGPSGSGKSTMMHLMGLLDTPTEGEVWIDGVATSPLTDRELAKLRNEKIGFVFQSFNLLPRTSALDNVALPLWYAQNTGRNYVERAAEALRRVGLDPIAKGKNHPNQLSGGQQQRVAIARAIVTQPSLILADEPTGNLDSRSTEEILALFQSLNDEGTTIVLVTHEDYVGQHAKRIVRFRDGQIHSDERVKQPLRADVGVSK